MLNGTWGDHPRLRIHSATAFNTGEGMGVNPSDTILIILDRSSNMPSPRQCMSDGCFSFWPLTVIFCIIFNTSIEQWDWFCLDSPTCMVHFTPWLDAHRICNIHKDGWTTQLYCWRSSRLIVSRTSQSYMDGQEHYKFGRAARAGTSFEQLMGLLEAMTTIEWR